MEFLDDVVDLEGVEFLVVCPDDPAEQLHEYKAIAFPDVLKEYFSFGEF